MDNFKAPDEAESTLHFLDYWRIIRIRKTVILAVFLLVVITTTAVTVALPKYYEGTTRIRVEKDTPDLDEMMGSVGSVSFDPYFIQTEFEVITSKSVLDEVIRRLNLTREWAEQYNVSELKTQDAYRLLRGSLDVNQERNTSLINIDAYSRDPEEAARIANTVAEVYKDRRIEVWQERSRSALTILEEQLAEQKAKVDAAEELVDRLKEQYNIVDTQPMMAAGAASLDLTRVTRLQDLLIQAERKYDQYSTVLENLRSLEEGNRDVFISSIPTAWPDSILSDLIIDKNSYKQELAIRSENLTEQHPEVRQIQSAIDEIESQIDDRVTGILNGLESQVATSRADVETLDAAMVDARGANIQSSTENRDYESAKRDLEILSRVRTALIAKIEQEKIDMQIPRSAIVEVTDRAEVSERHVRPNMAINVFLGCVVGLVVGVGLAFFIEYLDTSVKTIDDVERALQAPVLGVIPQNVGYLMEEGAESPHAEAYRVLRTNILFSRKDESGNTITVVSGGAGEGKSTTLFNLATVFAQNGNRILVIDSDLRRPSIHRIIGVSNSVGLTNYLLKTKELDEVIQTTDMANLDVMPSGKLPSTSMGILNSPRMKELVDIVRARYDFVFFDSPPIMGVSDASVLASMVDMTVQVIQYRKYPQAMTLRAKQMVEKVGKNLLGIVLNNINMSQDSDYYYYSGYYYDYYSSDNKEPDEETSSKKNGNPKKESKEQSRIDIKQKY